jgi:hypothetical protein
MLIAEYSAPRAFVSRVVAPTLRYLDSDKPLVGMVVFRVPLLGQALRYALRRDDSEGVGTALEGLLNLQGAYIRAARSHPEVRYWHYDGSQQIEGWMGEELRRVFVAATEEALRLQMPQDDLDLLVNHHASAAIAAIEASQVEESTALLTGLAHVATTPYQVSDLGARFLSRSAVALAAAERAAEQQNLEDTATLALACWAVAIVYPQFHTGVTHPLFDESIANFGPRPPWDLAIAKVKEARWRQQWANQLRPDALDFLPEALEISRARLAGSAGQSMQNAIDKKRTAYRNWIDVTQGLVSSPFQPGWTFEDFVREIDTAKAALELVASTEVSAAVQNYIDHLYAGIGAVLEATARIDNPDEKKAAAEAAFEGAMREHHDRVRAAMRRDLGADV